MSTATVNGVDLAYVEQGQGEPVLFVHGAQQHLIRRLVALAGRLVALAAGRSAGWAW